MEEAAALYRFLYFREGNTENFIDYEKLIDLYNCYLKGVSTPYSNVYMNMNFLGQAVYGFRYLYDYIYDENSSPSLFEMQNYIYYTDLKIRSLPSSQKQNLSKTDYNFIWSFTAIDEIYKNRLESFGKEVIDQMKLNSYQIYKTYQKSNIKGM